MSEIKISGFDQTLVEHTLLAVFNSKITTINYDKTAFPPFTTDAFLKKAISYHDDNYGTGQPYFEREFLKQFNLADKNAIDCTFLRCLAITLPFYEYNLQQDLSIDMEFENYMFNTLHFDWSGDMGTQPYIYMISNDLIQNYTNSVNNLYKAGILYKYTVNSKDSFFVPFNFSDYPKIDSYQDIELWNQIKKSINKAIRKMTM